MITIQMGLNTDPDFLTADEKIAEFEKDGNAEMVNYWKERKSNSLDLKATIENTMETDGECKLNWSCDGRTRFAMHATHWCDALAHHGWEWEIDDNYKCIIRK